MTEEQHKKWLSAVWCGHLAEMNPDARHDISREEMVGVAWEIAAVLAFLGFVLWLSFLPHGA